MYRRVLAFDYDGTLAENGAVPASVRDALAALQQQGHALFLVTGRRFQSIALGPLQNLFTGIAWENGAVLSRTATNEAYMPFGYLDPRLIEALESAGVLLEHGLAIVSTWSIHEPVTRHVLAQWGGGAGLFRNKGAVMIAPPGATKGTGLEHLLKLCGFSPRNLASFGDGENDLSLLQAGEIGIAVADAVPILKQAADLVTEQPGSAGVLEALERYWLHGSPLDIVSKNERWIPLGRDDQDNPFLLPAWQLAGCNIGIFGDPASGKSWVAGLLAEGMHLAGYQTLLVDLEGDFRGLRVLPRIVALDGDQSTLPAPSLVVTLLEETGVSVVLDMCGYPASLREDYISDLLCMLGPLRRRRFRPHWIVFEEAQQCLSRANNRILEPLLPVLDAGGCTLISYRPDRLGLPVLERLDHCLLFRLTNPEAGQAVHEVFGVPEAAALDELPAACALLDGVQLIALPRSARRVQHIRHLYKYLDVPLPRHKRFYFRDERGYLGQEAASLLEFRQALASLPVDSLLYHHGRSDFARWVREALDDAELAEQLRRLDGRQWEGEALREALVAQVTERFNRLREGPGT
jgi:hypothetical protein